MDIQKIKHTGVTPIKPGVEAVLISTGPGVTEAILPPLAQGNKVIVIRTQESTSPSIVHRVKAQGEPLWLEGEGPVGSVELVQFQSAYLFTPVASGTKPAHWQATKVG